MNFDFRLDQVGMNFFQSEKTSVQVSAVPKLNVPLRAAAVRLISI